MGLLSRPGVASISEGALREALSFANTAASIVCSRKGANPPTLAEVEEKT
jgi:fructokinase